MRHHRHTRVLLISSLLCTTVAALWIRSYIRWDEILLRRDGHTWINSYRGCLTIVRQDFFGAPAVPLGCGRRFVSSRNLLVYWSIDSVGFPPTSYATKPVLGFFSQYSASGSGSGSETRCVVQVPYWSLLLLTAIPMLAWLKVTLRTWSRRGRGCCEACGYDLRATQGRCPECGSVPDSGTRQPWRDRLRSGVQLRRKRRARLAIGCGACLALALGIHVARRATETESDQIDRLIRETCVDCNGNLDEDIMEGSLQPMTLGVDLNGDEIPEKIVLFYFWPKWGNDPESAARYFRSQSKDGWDVNGILILRRQGKAWRAASYSFWDEDGRSIHLGRSAATGLHYLFADTDGPCLVWGASKRGGEVGPLTGVQMQYARSVQIPRFEVRTGYPK
jgi:hypothetical protein